jgi:hypothetical protein
MMSAALVFSFATAIRWFDYSVMVCAAVVWLAVFLSLGLTHFGGLM